MKNPTRSELNPEKRTLKKNASCRRIKATGGVLSMSKRKWTDMKQYEEIILRMVSEGGTRKSIADELGLEPLQIKNFMHRYRASKK